MRMMLALVCSCALAQTAAAQTIYKCTADGRVSYGEQPCAHGRTTTLALPPAPDSSAANAMLEQDKARLAAFQKQRALGDARADRERQRAARAAAATRQKCAHLHLQATWAAEDAARAGKAAAERARLKARRQAEALAVQCPA
jgi:hypothetical protein